MKPEWKTCLKVGVSAFILYLCIYYWPSVAGVATALIGAAFPLFLGGFVAYIINILMSMYERVYFPRSTKAAVRKSRRPICLTAAVLSLLAVIALIIWLVVPQLISCIALLIAQLPDAIRLIIDRLAGWDLVSENLMGVLNDIDWKSTVSNLVSTVTSGIGSVMDFAIGAVTSVFSGIVSTFLAIIFAIYLLISKEKLGNQAQRIMQRYMKDNVYKTVRYVVDILDDCFHRYIVGQCTEALILGVLCLIGMLILQLPYAAMISALIAFTALIPVAGAYIGAVVGALMIMTQSPIKALIFIVFLIVLQQLEGNLIYPRVVGSSMGLPAIWVLAAVTVGGGVMGVIGMLFGVPIAAAIYRLIRNDVKKGEAKAQPEQKEENNTNEPEQQQSATS